ncbi:MAG: extracellular solute-binding protein [Microbacteriaceae bacterium]|nr:MAG: extracellular solute-binding protein [Microbacteriaceae bacterium]
MKRSTALAAVAAMVASIAMLATGCSSTSSGSTSSGQDGSADHPVTLTFWGSYGNGGNSTQQDALNNTLIPAFEKANPGITVKYTDIAYDSLLQKLTTSAAGGQLPDLVRADLGWVPQFAQDGVLVPLSDTMKDYKALAAKDYKGNVATNLYKGKYYGLPLDTNTRVLITDQAALAKAGVSTPPKTFADLKAMGDNLKGTGVSLFADSGLGAWNISPWIWSGGGELTNKAETKASGYLNSDTNVSTIQMLVDWYKAGLIPNLITGNKGATGTSDGLPKGKYATIFDGPWMAGIWSSQYPQFKPTYSPIPAGDGGSISVVGGEDIVLTANSKHQAAAEKFIRFTQGKQFQLAMAKTGQMTVVPAFADEQAKIAAYYQTFSDQLKTAKSRIASPNQSKIDTVLTTTLTSAFLGTTTVKAALDSAAAQIDALLGGS